MEELLFLVEIKEGWFKKYLPIQIMARNVAHAKFVAQCHVRFKLNDNCYFRYDYYPKAIES